MFISEIVLCTLPPILAIMACVHLLTVAVLISLQNPIGCIDLKQCITDVVGVIPRDVCARPNTFELITVRRQTKGDSETLVTRCYNTMTTTK